MTSSGPPPRDLIPWQYYTAVIPYGVEGRLDEHGAAGWELITLRETREGWLAVFKRPGVRPPA